MALVFDNHVHVYPEAIAEKAVRSLNAFYDFVSAGKGTLADYMAQAKGRASGMLMFCVATNPHQVPKVNDGIAAAAETARKEGFTVVAYAGLHQDTEDKPAELDRCRAMGLTGVKLHPDIQGVDIDDPRLFALYDYAQQYDLPICFHMGDNRPQYRFSEPRKLAKVLTQFPRLRVIAAHLGGYRARLEAIEYLAGNEYVWYDTSSSLWYLTPEEAADSVRKLGAERCLFATDYPVATIESELARLDLLGLTDRQKEMIHHENAAAFHGIDV